MTESNVQEILRRGIQGLSEVAQVANPEEVRRRDPREKGGLSAFSVTRNSTYFEGEQHPDGVS